MAAAAEAGLRAARSAMLIPTQHLRLHPVLRCGAVSMLEWSAGCLAVLCSVADSALQPAASFHLARLDAACASFVHRCASSAPIAVIAAPALRTGPFQLRFQQC